MIVLTLIKIVSTHLIITKNTMTKSFNPKNLLSAVAFLNVIIVNTINREHVIYFAVPAGLIMLFLWYKTFEFNSANNVTNSSNKTFAIVTLITIIVTIIVSRYNGIF